MKKVFGWVLTILGGFFCFVGVMCIPAAFAAENVSFPERIMFLLTFAGFAVINGLLCRKGIRLKSKAPSAQTKGEKSREDVSGTWMTSQLPALYLHDQKDSYRDAYISKLCSLDIKNEDAQKLFQFECSVIRRFEKPYLRDPQFTNKWIFGLKQPLFRVYPGTKAAILKEKNLTISELCKIIDEAEWHFWNSHEKNLPDAVWAEICAWRLKGPGAEFAISYFEMIAKETGVPMDSLAKLSAEQGTHLSRYKWH